MTHPVPEWLQTATFHEDGIGGSFTVREDFVELFDNVEAELKRVGKKIARRKELTKTPVTMYYKVSEEALKGMLEEDGDPFIPHIRKMRLAPIDETEYYVGDRGQLITKDERRGFVISNITDAHSKAEVETILEGLQKF